MIFKVSEPHCRTTETGAWYNAENGIHMADQREFTGISRAKLNGLRTELGKLGIEIPEGDDVEVKGPLGVRLRATYNEPGQTLLLAITDKPVFVSENQIWRAVENGAGSLGS